MNETEQLEKQLNSILHSYISYNLDETIRIDPSLIEGRILQACNQWLEEQGAQHKVKCSYCSFYKFADGEVVGMSPCYECNSTGYTFGPLRLEIDA